MWYTRNTVNPIMWHWFVYLHCTNKQTRIITNLSLIWFFCIFFKTQKYLRNAVTRRVSRVKLSRGEGGTSIPGHVATKRQTNKLPPAENLKLPRSLMWCLRTDATRTRISTSAERSCDQTCDLPAGRCWCDCHLHRYQENTSENSREAVQCSAVLHRQAKEIIPPPPRHTAR